MRKLCYFCRHPTLEQHLRSIDVSYGKGQSEAVDVCLRCYREQLASDERLEVLKGDLETIENARKDNESASSKHHVRGSDVLKVYDNLTADEQSAENRD